MHLNAERPRSPGVSWVRPVYAGTIFCVLAAGWVLGSLRPLSAQRLSQGVLQSVAATAAQRPDTAAYHLFRQVNSQQPMLDPAPKPAGFLPKAPDHRYEGAVIGLVLFAATAVVLGTTLCEPSATTNCTRQTIVTATVAGVAGAITGALIGGAITKGSKREAKR